MQLEGTNMFLGLEGQQFLSTSTRTEMWHFILDIFLFCHNWEVLLFSRSNLTIGKSVECIVDTSEAIRPGVL